MGSSIPELADYVVVAEIYKLRTTSNDAFAPVQEAVDLDGLRYKGPVHLVSGLFIEEQWNFGVHEDFPDTQTVSKDLGGNIASKIFSEDDFVHYFRSHFGAPMPTTTVTADLSTRKIRMLTPCPPPLPEFANPDLQNAVQPLRDLYNRYTVATSGQAGMQKEGFALMQAFVPVYLQHSAKQSASENQKYNDFVTQVTSTLGASAIIIGPAK